MNKNHQVPAQRSRRGSLWLTTGCLVLLATSATAQKGAPSKKEAKELFGEYLTIDGRSQAGIEERKAIRERLESFHTLRKSEVKTWRKDLLKIWGKGP